MARARANENNRRARSVVELMRQAGKNYSEIARALNGAGFRTARGSTFQPE